MKTAGVVLLWVGMVNLAALLQQREVLQLGFSPVFHVIPSVVGALFGFIIAKNLELRRRELQASQALREREASIARLNAELAAAMSRTETALRDAKRQLVFAQKSDLIGQLTTGVVHDFNNILTGIMGSVEFLRENARPGDIETLALIIDSCNRATLLNSRLLKFSRNEEELLERVELGQIARQMVPMLNWFKGGRTVLETSFCDEPTPILLGEGVAEQIILNLVSNASNALEGEDGTIHVSTRVEGDHVVLEVEDNGPGMDEETRARVFEAFFTTKGDKGTGLGLAIVKNSIDRYGGAIELISEPGKGAKFVLRFERAPAETSAMPASSEHEAPPSGIRVLLVDADAAIRKVATIGLERGGYQVESCGNCLEALRMVEEAEAPFGVVITNVALHDGDGMSLLGGVKARCAHSQLVLTGGFITPEASLKHEGVDFLPKPFTPSQLRGAVASALARRSESLQLPAK